ncbi:SigE family RNA polymerase sigma factor [Nocardioides ferulae]|uniref:SigE family RNA polymerase sigma factor n=1 Tax=Nocardioides ferulae TaxID=2340821 RepID=UPI000EB26F72|nr:SigE family RNA polymerase sigma factor [Nocardioides ferulae]
MDEAEFADYAAARWQSLVRAGVFLGCSLDEAQDLAQTTLVRCFAKWSKVRRADDRDAYVYRVLLRCHTDSRRRRWWGEQPTAQPPDRADPDASTAVDVTDAVHRALAGLSDDHRAVVVLRVLADLSERQAAEVLGVSTGTVKSRLSRALARLAGDDAALAHLTTANSDLGSTR